MIGSTCASFHDAILLSGSVPLDVLEANVERYIESGGTIRRRPVPSMFEKTDPSDGWRFSAGAKALEPGRDNSRRQGYNRAVADAKRSRDPDAERSPPPERTSNRALDKTLTATVSRASPT